MPQSLRKSLTAWLQLPALPPTPIMNIRPPFSRSDANSAAKISTLAASILEQIAPDWAKNSVAWLVIDPNFRTESYSRYGQPLLPQFG